MSPPPTETAKLGGRAAWIALVLIALTQAMSMVDRQILAILVPRIKADLRVEDAEMGLLYGTVFALFYAVFSLPLGRLADGWVRTRLLSVSIILWSAATALAGFANSFGVLALSRLGVGVGEASVQPAGMSLLADSFPKHKRGMVMSWMAAAVSLGLGGALVLGGLTAGAWDQAWPHGGAPFGLKGWQAAFLVASIPGLVLGALLLRLPEPARGAADGRAPPPDPAPIRGAWRTLYAILPLGCWINLARCRAGVRDWLVNLAGLAIILVVVRLLIAWTDGLRPNAPPLHLLGLTVTGSFLQWWIAGFGCYVLLNWLQSLRLTDKPAFVLIAKSPAMLLVLAVGALQSVINYGVMGFTPSFLIQHYRQDPASVALIFGSLAALIGIIGPLIAGPLSDWAHRRVSGGRLYVTLAALTISPFLAFYTYEAVDITSFYLRFVLYSLALTAWLPPIYATYLDLVLPRMRGSVISLYILSMTIIGLGTGPYAVGLISDVNGHDLGHAILSLYWIGPLIVLLIVGAIVRLPKDEALLVGRAVQAGEQLDG